MGFFFGNPRQSTHKTRQIRETKRKNKENYGENTTKNRKKHIFSLLLLVFCFFFANPQDKVPINTQKKNTQVLNNFNYALTFGADLPYPGILASKMFYFNIAGSNNQKDVKLVAFLSHPSFNCNECVYFDNDITNQWQSMQYHPLKWNLPTQFPFFTINLEFLVNFCCVVESNRVGGWVCSLRNFAF